MTELLLISGAFFAGLVGGFLGLGGGIILVPFLSLVILMPMHQAVAISLATIMANSLVSSTEYLRKDMVDLRLVILLSIFASVGAVAGSILGKYIPGDYLQVAFSLVLAYTTYSILKKKDNTDPKRKSDHNPNIWMVALIALLAGIVSSLLGVGGGILIVPAIYLIFNYPMNIARGSSAFTIGVIATAGSVVYFVQGILNVEFAGQIMLGTIAGGWLGGWLGTRAKSNVVKAAFSLLLIYLAIKMFLQGIA
jgi:uncharacterized protein